MGGAPYMYGWAFFKCSTFSHERMPYCTCSRFG